VAFVILCVRGRSKLKRKRMIEVPMNGRKNGQP